MISVIVILLWTVTVTVAVNLCILGGYYSAQLKSGLHLVMLNTNLYYYQDQKMGNHSDPAGQFAWLENILKDAKENSVS